MSPKPTEDAFEEAVGAYDYALPPELIASQPANPRDSSRLLVFDRKNDSMKTDAFRNIIDYLPERCMIVFNRTKVIPARFTVKRKEGAALKVLFTRVNDGCVVALAKGKFTPGEILVWEGENFFTVEGRSDREVMLRPSFPIDTFRSLLEGYGETPLPPYIRDCPLPEGERRRLYQTVYAHSEGSVAAPTAGLHFTPELLQKIEASGRTVRYVTLHVNLGTFAPLTPEQWHTKALHTEAYEIDPETAADLNAAKKSGRPIVAVGTTTVRTLEAATEGSVLSRLTGETNLFITEGHRLRFVDALITNFHVPRSSLLMLVSAFVGREKLMELYRYAIEKKFRFFSFGDAMLIT